MRFRYLLLLAAAQLGAQERPSSWNTPQQAFRIYGDTYYVGTRGLSSILITSPTGDVLIDGALPESAPLIVANIRSLGFRPEDIKLIVNSHAHFDHAGGIAELQKLSGARVAASPWTADVMKRGVVPHDDPQFGTIVPIPKVARVETIHDGESLIAGGVTVTAHFTPGHTPGGTSWTWISCETPSCENGRRLQMVYFDSVAAVAAKGFRFSDRRQHPHAVTDFEKSFSFLEITPCDVLMTPHPEASNFWERVEERKSRPDALIDPKACKALAETGREQLKKRLATEGGK